MVVEFFEVVVDGCRRFLLLVTTRVVSVFGLKRMPSSSFPSLVLQNGKTTYLGLWERGIVRVLSPVITNQNSSL